MSTAPRKKTGSRNSEAATEDGARLSQPQHGRIERRKPRLQSEQSIAAAAAETAALRRRCQDAPTAAHTQLLLLPDGRVLAHNLTPAMAEVLQQLDPGDALMRLRSLPNDQLGAQSRADSSSAPANL